MATRDAPDGEGGTAHEAVLHERKPRVFGTGRREATRARQERRDERLVNPEQSHCEARRDRHGRGPGIALRAPCSSSASAVNGCRSAPGRPMITRSVCEGAALRIAR